MTSSPLLPACGLLILICLVPFAALDVRGADPDPKSAPVPEATSSGVIEGTVTFRGEIPKSSVTDDAGVRRNLLQVDRATRGLANVVVWLVLEKNAAEEMAPEADARGAGKAAVMDQLDHEFVPRVLGVRAGQPVNFTNSDAANHNVRTASRQPANEFNVFTGMDGSHAHRFAADPEQRPVRVGCDIHPWMRGWIYVFDHPWFAVTDTHGRFRINAVPPGRHWVMLRQPDIRYAAEREVTVETGKVVSLNADVSLPEGVAPGK